MFYLDQNYLAGFSPAVVPHPDSLGSMLKTKLTTGLFLKLEGQGMVSNHQLNSW